MTVEVDNSVAAPEAPAVTTANDPKVVDAISAHLDAFNESIGEPVSTPEPKEEKPAETPAEESVAQTPAEEIVPAEETPAGEAVVEPKGEASTLPAAYVRTAKARGWTDEEIADFSKANPDVAMKTFERMHASRTQEINEWAELGRKTRQSAPSAGAQNPAPVTPVAPAATGLKPVNVAELVEKYGNQELIEAIAGPVNEAIKAFGPLISEASEAKVRNQQAAQETLAKTVNDFFTDKTMAPFVKAYGKDYGSLTPAQVETRSKVLETADALLAGAAFQGRQLSVQQALELAHDSVSSGLKETIIRDQIKSKVTKRAAGITLRPTASGRRDPGAPPRDKAELVSRTEDRLAKAFG